MSGRSGMGGGDCWDCWVRREEEGGLGDCVECEITLIFRGNFDWG